MKWNFNCCLLSKSTQQKCLIQCNTIFSSSFGGVKWKYIFNIRRDDDEKRDESGRWEMTTLMWIQKFICFLFTFFSRIAFIQRRWRRKKILRSSQVDIKYLHTTTMITSSLLFHHLVVVFVDEERNLLCLVSFYITRMSS